MALKRSSKTDVASTAARVRVVIRGAVQGVGFRPFVFKVATELRLNGWVSNTTRGVCIEAEGEIGVLETFVTRLETEKPAIAVVQSFEHSFLDPTGMKEFRIVESDPAGSRTVLVMPDIATCPDCLSEILDPTNRRYRYPFTNCTNCGPRYSIIEALPYDRPNTSMKSFPMCEHCRSEYEDPGNRRFHAQPNACPECGPQIEFWDPKGATLDRGDGALSRAVAAIRAGKIVAVKGLGGFHLMVDAASDGAVNRLRSRKRREEKPLAVMFPGIDAVRKACRVSEPEQRVLCSTSAPIVLLSRGETASEISEAVAPANPYLGAMLPYTPLHHLLMSDLRCAVVATSGNVSDEPICINEREAVDRLAGIADFFLVHNRPIVRHVDDSLVRVILGRELVLRRARGFAPLPVRLPGGQGREGPLLCVGAHLKNSVSAVIGNDVFVSQHIGDLETVQAHEAFRNVIRSFSKLYSFDPKAVGCDLHPDYLSTQFAEDFDKPLTYVQHHAAHVLSCIADNDLEAPVLGVSWDGTGLGPDRTIWGGEFFVFDGKACSRVGHLRLFGLPGGDQAINEPARSAMGLLYESYSGRIPEMDLKPCEHFEKKDLRVLSEMLRKKLNTPQTSSAGRLFDAVSALCGVRQTVVFEGQAAMELEFCLPAEPETTGYPFGVSKSDGCWVVDWEPMIRAVLADLAAAVPVPLISARFHNGLADAIVAVARCVEVERVVLTGGCFQNKYLTEQTVHRLREAGFRPYWHQRIPPNDGGISVGQAVAVSLGIGTPILAEKKDTE